ncbi:SWIM zinc finger family protein [Corynebacterium otitidis]|uniref:SWIM zinc finger family protein n=1 Tax=Corynebacterium otitidis TaxID=29321 RepID=UPI000627EB42|nr:SWIM zinc finger family protein [Corynebacterium otitidis]KKO83723.1 hypothetical protein AAV33_04880 [Corynebacterium otitidis]
MAEDDNVIYADFAGRTGSRSRRGGCPGDAAARGGREQQEGPGVTVEPGDVLLDLVCSGADPMRVRRGRDYAREGRVEPQGAEGGRISASVQGSQAEPFEASIVMPHRGADELARALRLLEGDYRGIRRARQGQVPVPVAEALFARSPRQVRMSCTCPDDAVPCKHLVAVATAYAAWLRRHPEEAFSFRGVDLADLEESLRRQRSNDERPELSTGTRFWDGGAMPDLPEPETRPAIEESDLGLLHQAMRGVSYSVMAQLRAVSDIEDLYAALVDPDERPGRR